MKAFMMLAAAVAIFAGAGWLAADDRARDLEERVRALEAKLSGDAVLEARGLVVRDDAGGDVLVIDSPQKECARLRMLGADSEERILMEVDMFQAARVCLNDPGAHRRLTLDLIKGNGARVSLRGTTGSQKHLLIKAPDDGAVGMGMWGGPGKMNETSHGGFWIWEDGTIAWGGGIRSAGRTGFILKYPRDGDMMLEFRDAEEEMIWKMPTTGEGD